MRAGGPGAEARWSGVMHREIWRPKLRLPVSSCASALVWRLRKSRTYQTGGEKSSPQERPAIVIADKPLDTIIWRNFSLSTAMHLIARCAGSANLKLRAQNRNALRKQHVPPGCRTAFRLSVFFETRFSSRRRKNVRHPAPPSTEEAMRRSSTRARRRCGPSVFGQPPASKCPDQG